MDDKITIIEGPPPEFEEAREGWALGLNEGNSLSGVTLTRLRTFNAPALVERCYRAWHSQGSIFLHYRSPEGLERMSQIVAVRAMQTSEGQMIYLWVRQESHEVEIELGYDDEDDDEDNPPTPF